MAQAPQNNNSNQNQNQNQNQQSRSNIFQRVFQRAATPSNQSRQQDQNQNNKNITSNSTPVNDLEGANQNDSSQKKAKSPLDQFTEMLQNAPNDDGNKNQPPSFSLTPDKLKDHVEKMDFVSGLPAEVQQQLAGLGDQGKLFSNLLNHVGRQAYANALHHGSVLTDKAIGERSNFDSQQIDGRIRTTIAKNAFHKPNAHPVVRQFQEMMAEQILQVKPDATADEIAEFTNSFFTELGTAVGGGTNSQDQNSTEQEEDVNWLEFVGRKASNQ